MRPGDGVSLNLFSEHLAWSKTRAIRTPSDFWQLSRHKKQRPAIETQPPEHNKAISIYYPQPLLTSFEHNFIRIKQFGPGASRVRDTGCPVLSCVHWRPATEHYSGQDWGSEWGERGEIHSETETPRHLRHRTLALSLSLSLSLSYSRILPGAGVRRIVVTSFVLLNTEPESLYKGLWQVSTF